MDDNAKDIYEVYGKRYAEVGKRYKVYRRQSIGGTVERGGISMSDGSKMKKLGNATCTEEYTFHYIFKFENHVESISKQELHAGMYTIKEVKDVK